MSRGRDYYGRFLGLPTDHPDNDADADAPCFDDPPDYSDEEPLRDPKYADAASANWFAYRTKGVCE